MLMKMAGFSFGAGSDTHHSVKGQRKTLLMIGVSLVLWSLLSHIVIMNKTNVSEHIGDSSMQEVANEKGPAFNQQHLHNEEGFPLLEHMPLLPFELRSAVNRTCDPPHGIPRQCCLGSNTYLAKDSAFHPGKCRIRMVSETLIIRLFHIVM